MSDDAVKVFVGCAANNEDLESQAVLHYTLEKFSSRPVQIEWMQQSKDPASFWHGWNASGWTTPFTGFRWGIPERCNFEGRAIYMDSDMIVRDNIAKLWRFDLHPHAVMASKGTSKRFCVMLFDCNHARNYMLPLAQLKKAGSHRVQREKFTGRLVQAFPPDQNWNCLDGESYASLDDPAIKIIHYTAIDTQPQLRHALPRLSNAGVSHWFKGKPRAHRRADVPALFDRCLEEAIAAGYRPENYSVDGLGDYAVQHGGRWANPGPREELARAGRL
jgi:hypothetical protein